MTRKIEFYAFSCPNCSKMGFARVWYKYNPFYFDKMEFKCRSCEFSKSFDPISETKCVDCGSKSALTQHHIKEKYLSHNNPNKSQETILLCETCHYLRDYKKSQRCFYSALMERYLKEMNKLENYYRLKETEQYSKTPLKMLICYQ